MNLIDKKDLRNLQIRKLTEFGKTQQKQLEDEIKEKHANVTWAQLFYNTSEELVKNYIKNEKIVEKRHPRLPEKVTNIIKCKNPRCITSDESERELPHIFKLTNREKNVYRCIYCEQMYKRN